MVYAAIERIFVSRSPLAVRFSFLEQGISRHLAEPVKLLAVDTLAVEKRRLLRQQEVFKEGS